MRVGVQVGRAERPGDEARLEGGLVHTPTAEEARALDDVERAELGRDDVDDAQPGGGTSGLVTSTA